MNKKVFDDSISEDSNRIAFKNLDKNWTLYSQLPQTWLRLAKLILVSTEVLE